MINNLYKFFPGIFLFLIVIKASGQTVVGVNDHVNEHIFTYGEIRYLEDREGKLTIDDIRSAKIDSQFRENKRRTPKTANINATYWFKFKIKHNSKSVKNWLIEFFDQTIDILNVYVADENNIYHKYTFGDSYDFRKREYKHKNFTIDLNNDFNGERTYYVQLKSSQSASFIVVLREVQWFVAYALDEYLFFGLFYGMIMVFSLYNILMYFAVRQRQYLYYVLYNLSVAFYEMSVDGVAFQYVWPALPSLNQYSFGITLFLSSFFGLLFTISFLCLKSKAPFLYRIILTVMGLRVGFFICCLFLNELFNYRIVEIVPLATAFYSGVYIYRKGYKPARFFVVGYSFLLLGFLIKMLVLINVPWLPHGPITYYSLSFCFLVEMVFLSLAIGDNIRLLRKKKDKAQRRVIRQLELNEKLKDKLNKELSQMVEARTKELVEKAKIIARQNDDLSVMNSRLQHQAEEISRMNKLLEKDNKELQVNIEKVTRARVMSQDVDFTEFSKIYPDREACFKYLADLKWESGYSCRKCSNTNYMGGQLPYSRRCTKCRYEESVISNTIFQNSRIPINKAFYMLYLIYTTKGKISSHKLAEILSIRQSTCWAYSAKMKKILEDKKRELRNAGERGWSKMVLDVPEESRLLVRSAKSA